VYSTGCLLYELLTGKPPFQGDSPVAVAYQHVRENAVAPSAVNPAITPAVDSVVMKALAKNPLNRYQSAAEMRADLQRALADRPVEAEAVMTDAERTQFIAASNATPPIMRPPVMAADEYGEEPNRNGAWIWVAVVVALLLVIGLGAYLIVRTNSSKAKLESVPSILGQTRSAAETTLRNAGFQPGNVTNTSGSCGAAQVVGNVCTQQYPAGSKQAKNTAVDFTLYVQGTVSVPTCVNGTLNDCEAALNKYNLKWTVVTQNNSAADGTVLSTSPEAFTNVAPGSTVTINVSSGKVPIPNEVGKAQADAVADLSNNGFGNVSVVSQPTTDKTKDGVVLSQLPTAGSLFPPSSQKITLNVGAYTPPSPTCTTAPPTPSAGASTSAAASATATGSALPPC